MALETINTLDPTPFRNIVMTVGNLPTSYVDSMSYYEMLSWLCNYLETKVIPTVNGNAAAVEELQGLFVELTNYVNHYFDNLDVQEEIDNKLDEMATDGTLQEIINAYINSNATLGFDTLADMKSNENIVAGSYCHILGRMALNDGGSNFYKARLKTVDDVVDNVKIVQLNDPTLVAELIIKDEYFNLVPTYTRYIIDETKNVGTDVWYCIIPSDYKPELFLANDAVNNVEYANSCAYRNKTSLLINAGLFNTETDITTGLVINNGVTLKTNTDLSDEHSILYMAADGTLDCVDGTTPTSTVEALEPVWAVTAWDPIVKDGIEIEHSTTDYKPRTFIGQDAQGNYIIGVATGRKYNQQGMTQPNIKAFVESVGFTPYFLFNLDGGGSSEMLCDGRRVTRQDFFNSRKLANFIGWRKLGASNESLFKSNYNTDVLENNFEYEREPKNQLQRLTIHSDAAAQGGQLLGAANSCCLIYGQMATINIQFKTTGTLAAYKRILQGLPLPYQTSNLAVLAMCLDDNSVYKLTIQPTNVENATGVADLCVGQYGGGLPAGRWFVNVSYPIKDGENALNF